MLKEEKNATVSQNKSEMYNKYLNDLEQNHPELLTMMSKMAKVQDDVLNGYFTNSYVIRFNYLQYLKTKTKEISSKEEFAEWLLSEMKRMKSIGRTFTHIERVEYRFIRKIYRDIINGEGEELDLSQDLIYNYDDTEIKVEHIKFGEIEE